MSGGINRFKNDLRDQFFVLFEQFRFGEVAGKGPFEAWGPDEAKAVLNETYRFAREVLGPLNSTGDREGCRLENGEVKTPTGFKDAWAKLYEGGYRSLAASPELGGQGAPTMLASLVEELCSGANIAFNMYPGLTHGAAEVIAEFGTPEQKQRYAVPMISGAWGGTMCLTEPQAGSDVGANTTSARKQADGTYLIKGTKIFISGGDQDITAQHRAPGARAHRGRAAGNQGPLAVHRAQVPGRRGRQPGRAQRRGGRVHRAQDGHQRLGHLRDELRRQRDLRRRAGRRGGAPRASSRCST